MKSILTLLAIMIPLAAHAQASGTVYIEEMTWTELQARVNAGANAALIPIGATEQGGPHIALGSHNAIMRYAAGDIARKAGNTLVAPLVPYAPSGRIDPPEGHMNFPGTMSLSANTLAAVLWDTAASLKHSGFKHIFFIGETPGSQTVAQQVADNLNSQWAADGVQVMWVSAYDNQTAQGEWATSNGSMAPNPMAHAGMSDTSQVMAVAPAMVRTNELKAYNEKDYATTGAAGDATQSNPSFGRGILGVKTSAAVRQIKQAIGTSEQ